MYHNRKSPRLKGFEYSRVNAYLVRPVIHGRNQYFGEIIHGVMVLNEFGTIAQNQMMWLQDQYCYTKIPIWAIMPNHVHAIIEIVGDDYFGGSDSGCCRGRSRPAPAASGMIIKSLSSLMGAYKTTSSKLIHLAGLTEFAWQRSFHDHIIRNSYEYRNIYNYIVNNPINWDDDDFHSW